MGYYLRDKGAFRQAYGLLGLRRAARYRKDYSAHAEAVAAAEGRAEMRRTENTELTVLCLLRDGDRLLLQDRVKNDWKGYTLPGGHVEPGESFVDAVKREMKEETGLEIINPKLAGIKQFPIDDGRYIVLLFKVVDFTGEVISSEEGQMEWVDRSNLSEIETVNDLEQLLEVIDNPKLTEFQYLVNEDEWTASIK